MRNSKGFTLIELVVVMGIIAILTGLVTFNFQQARGRARDIQRKNDLKAMQKALELYKGDQDPQAYPAGGGVIHSTLSATLGATDNYLKNLPVDPRESASDGSWVDYTYTRISATEYTMTACLENVSDSACGATCSTGKGCVYTETQP